MTAWIHRLHRAELVCILTENSLSDTGTVDELRRRLCRFAVNNPHVVSPPGTETPDNMPRDYEDAPKAGPSTEGATMLPSLPPLASPLIPIASASEPARVVDQIRKWGHHFDGKDPVLFLERIVELQDAYGITPAQTLYGLPELLRGEPLLWYRNRRHGWATWSDFCTEFQAQYFPYRYRQQLRREATDYEQKPGETFAKFSNHLQTLARRAGGFSETEVRKLILENMDPEYHIFIRPDATMPMAQILERAAQFEALRTRQKGRTRDTTVPITVATAYNRNECCWRCKQRGHVRTSCQRPPRKFCSFCGKEGVFTRDCHPPAGNGHRTERDAAPDRSP